MGQTLQGGAFAHKAYQADVFISPEHIGTFVGCRRNSLRMLVKYALTLPWQCHRHTSTKNGQDFFQDGRGSLPENTQDSSLHTEKNVCPSEPGDIFQMASRNSYTLGWSASPLQEYMFFSLQGSPSSLANTHSPQALTLEFLNKGKQKLNP